MYQLTYTLNGSNFIGASRELQEPYKFLSNKDSQEATSKFCTGQGISYSRALLGRKKPDCTSMEESHKFQNHFSKAMEEPFPKAPSGILAAIEPEIPPFTKQIQQMV